MKGKSILFLAVLFLLAGCGDDDDLIIRDPQEQLEIDLEKIDDYLANKGIDAQIEPASGLRYVIHEQGTGNSPKISDFVTVNYVGKVMDGGKKFDEGEGRTFDLSGLILAWKIALPLIQEGGSMTMYVPSGYGYGIAGNPPEIDGNENLIFDVDLIEIVE